MKRDYVTFALGIAILALLALTLLP